MPSGPGSLFARFASATSKAAGRPVTFVASVLIVLVWAATGPAFGYSDTWQLIVNTGTTIVTFFMVFLIQNAQNRDTTALHAKMDEIIHAIDKADDRLIGIEEAAEEEIAAVRPSNPSVSR